MFYGDSITQDYELSGPPEWRDFAPVWQRFYGDRHAVNLGFTGDATSHLLWRIENGEARGIDPKVAVILIGANNFGRLHWSAEDSAAGIDAIVTQLRHRLPHTRLVLLGVLPADRSAWATETTTAINQLLAARYGTWRRRDVPGYWARVHERRADWITTCSWTRSYAAQPRRCIRPRRVSSVMAEAIEPTLAKLLGDHPHGEPTDPLLSSSAAKMTGSSPIIGGSTDRRGRGVE